VNKVIIIILF